MMDEGPVPMGMVLSDMILLCWAQKYNAFDQWSSGTSFKWDAKCDFFRKPKF
jgi:hypothetical protein